MPTLYDAVEHNINGFSKLFTNFNEKKREEMKEEKKKNKERKIL